MLCVSEKVKVLDLIKRGGKKAYAEIAKIYGKNESSIQKIVKEKEICASFTATSQAA